MSVLQMVALPGVLQSWLQIGGFKLKAGISVRIILPLPRQDFVLVLTHVFTLEERWIKKLRY